MGNNKNQEPKELFWRCVGRKGEPHIEEKVTADKCPQCGKTRPSLVINKQPSIMTHQPKKDWTLLVALIILNIGSGFTTIYGAAKVLPELVGYTTGGAIQVLLFLLLSGSTLKHNPKLKWLVVGCFSAISIYTSFFAYYDFLTSKSSQKTSLERATSAHQNLVSEVFGPIDKKAQELKNELKSLDQLIQDEEAGRRISGLVGCGEICKELKVRQEKLKIKLNQIAPVVDNLQPLFKYDPQNKTPQEIFELDKKALGAVQPSCLPLEPQFVCLPNKYVGSLDTNNPKNAELSSTYFDQDLAIGLVSPFLKIKRGEPAAIGAAMIAFLVDGCIILLGIGVEVRKKPQKLSLRIIGLGSEFLDRLSELIDSSSMTINVGALQQEKNSREYLNLLQGIRAETNWISKIADEQDWQIISQDAENKLNAWLVQERQKQAQAEIKLANQARTGIRSVHTQAEVESVDQLAQTQTTVFIQLPTKYD